MTKTIDDRLVQHSLDVLAARSKMKSEGIGNWDWPTFNSEHERIKHVTHYYHNVSINETFARMYNIQSLANVKSEDNSDTYSSLKPGDIIPLYIQEVNKKGVVFKQGNIKETIICNSNLYQYPHFRNFIPTKPIECKVISCNSNKIVVDPFAGMFDEWINNHTKNLQSQYSMYLDKSVEVSNLHLVNGGFIGRVRIDTISDLCGKDMFVEAFIPGSQIVLNIEYNFESWEGKSTKAFITSYANKPYSPGMVLTCSAKEYLRHQGNKTIIDWFKAYCEDNNTWKAVTDSTFEGIVTGVCHTSSKCGAFIELPKFNITAMLPLKPEELSSYKRGSNIEVKISKFEEPTRFNGITTEHLAPYVIENDILKKCYVRLILKQA